jgi:hypothetical protein
MVRTSSSPTVVSRALRYIISSIIKIKILIILKNTTKYLEENHPCLAYFGVLVFSNTPFLKIPSSFAHHQYFSKKNMRDISKNEGLVRIDLGA